MEQDEKKSEFDPRWVRVVEATRALFLRYGYDHTSMKAIADQAHVSKATLYAYWSAKPDLFNSLVLWESLHTLDDWLRRVESDPEGEKVGHVLAHGMVAISANPVLHVLYSRDAQTLGDLLRERGMQLTTRRYNMGLDLVKSLQAAGLVRTDLPAEHISHILTVISVGLVSVGELYDPTRFPDFGALAISLGGIIQSALEPLEAESKSGNKFIMLEHLMRQRQVTLEALFSIYQTAEGDH